MKKLLMLACLACAASGAGAQQAYKWLDDKGVTHYGETPPANVQSEAVDTRPYGPAADGKEECHTIMCQAQRLDEEKKKQAEEDAKHPPKPPEKSIRGLEFATYIRIKLGMTEGEVLMRAGEPDDNIAEGYAPAGVFSYGLSKSYYYYPTPSDPFLTVISFRSGRVYNIQRIRKF